MIKKVIGISLYLFSTILWAQNPNSSFLDKYTLSQYSNWFFLPNSKYVRKEIPIDITKITKREYFNHLCETESFRYKSNYQLPDNTGVYKNRMTNFNLPQINDYLQTPFQSRYYILSRPIQRNNFNMFADNEKLTGQETILVDLKMDTILMYEKNFKLNNQECFYYSSAKFVTDLDIQRNMIKPLEEISPSINLTIENKNTTQFNDEKIIINNEKSNHFLVENQLKQFSYPIEYGDKFGYHNKVCSRGEMIYSPNDDLFVYKNFKLYYKDLSTEPVAYLRLMEVSHSSLNKEYYYFYFNDQLKKIKEGMSLDFDLNPTEQLQNRFYPLKQPLPSDNTFREYRMNDGTIFRITFNAEQGKYSLIQKVMSINANKIITFRQINNEILKFYNILGVTVMKFDKNTLKAELIYNNFYDLTKNSNQKLIGCERFKKY